MTPVTRVGVDEDGLQDVIMSPIQIGRCCPSIEWPMWDRICRIDSHTHIYMASIITIRNPHRNTPTE